MKRILFVITALTLGFTASALTGDVNGDGEVSISDINAVIDVILS